jgi:hypothetical protein
MILGEEMTGDSWTAITQTIDRRWHSAVSGESGKMDQPRSERKQKKTYNTLLISIPLTLDPLIITRDSTLRENE